MGQQKEFGLKKDAAAIKAAPVFKPSKAFYTWQREFTQFLATFDCATYLTTPPSTLMVEYNALLATGMLAPDVSPVDERLMPYYTVQAQKEASTAKFVYECIVKATEDNALAKSSLLTTPIGDPLSAMISLHQMISPNDYNAQLRLRDKLNRFRQRSDQKVNEYYSEFEGLLMEMRDSGIAPSEMEAKSVFLRGLKQYPNHTTDIFTINIENYTVARIAAQVHDWERDSEYLKPTQQGKKSKDDKDPTALLAQQKKGNKKGCFFCGIQNHMLNECKKFKSADKTVKDDKSKWPANVQAAKKKAAANKDESGKDKPSTDKPPKKKCTWCGGMNHIEEECRRKAAGLPRTEKPPKKSTAAAAEAED